MAKILRTTDLMKFTIGEVSFYVSPLSNARKTEVTSCTMIRNGEQVFDFVSAQHKYIKYGLKKIEGVEGYDGKPYELQFEGDCLTDDCVSEIFTLEEKQNLILCLWQVFTGVPEKFVDDNGAELQGVALEILPKEKQSD